MFHNFITYNNDGKMSHFNRLFAINVFITPTKHKTIITEHKHKINCRPRNFIFLRNRFDLNLEKLQANFWGKQDNIDNNFSFSAVLK